MKAIVDQTKCSSAGICVQRMPDVFHFEPGSKKARAIDQEIPDREVMRLVETAAACPTKAIELEREGPTEP